MEVRTNSSNAKFVFKAVTIGAVIFISFIASIFVQQMVDDRLFYQEEALLNQGGDTSKVLIHGENPGFDKETGISYYRLVDRAVKYAILFILLTFLVFFLAEVIYKLRLHPMQYLLVGLSLAEFYLLLLAFMEHIGFTRAYIIAALMTIGLIAFYSNYMLGTKKGALAIAGMLGVVYTYLFVILHLETYALLSGALLLFALIAVVMFVTRKLDWYEAFDYA